MKTNHLIALGMAMIAMGVVVAIYWTFAVDLIVAVGLDAAWIKQAFWFASGAAGVFDLVVSATIRRYGIRRVIPVNMLVLALALGIPAIVPSQLFAVMISAIYFGVGFITMTGLLAIWRVEIFEEKPSAGLGFVLILVAVGQVISPIIAGITAKHAAICRVA